MQRHTMFTVESAEAINDYNLLLYSPVSCCGHRYNSTTTLACMHQCRTGTSGYILNLNLVSTYSKASRKLGVNVILTLISVILPVGQSPQSTVAQIDHGLKCLTRRDAC